MAKIFHSRNTELRNLIKGGYDWLEDTTCPMHTASESPPGAVATLLGWESIFTTSEELKTKSWT